MKYVLFLIFLCFSSSGLSQLDKFNQEIDEILNQDYEGIEAGATVLVSKEGHIIYHKAFGLADVELTVPMKPDNVFKIASITKQFTAVSILMLMEKGKLELNDPISKYLKDFPNGDQITIHHLLTHTSGISNDITINPWNELMLKKEFQPLEFIDYFKIEPKISVPGEVYKYNNFGYFILGAIVEIISELSYENFLSNFIFIPLDMNNSYLWSQNKIIKKRVKGYSKSNGDLQKPDYYNLSQAFSAGGIMSTVEDLFTWNQAIHNNQLISAKTKRIAFTNHILINGSKINYGYGWFINDVNGFKSVEHAGSLPGFMSNAIYLPEERIYVAVLTNCDHNDPRYISKKIAALVAGRPYEEPKTKFKTDEIEIRKWVGQYTFSNGETRSIYLNRGNLYYILPNGSEIEMFPLSNSSFILENTFTKINFKMSGSLLVNMYTKNGNSEKVAVKEYQNHEEIDLQSTFMKKYLGEYQLFPDFSLIITLKDNQLFSTGTDQEPLDIFPESKTRFFFKSIDAYIDFDVDEEGNCNSLVITQDGRVYSGTRIE